VSVFSCVALGEQIASEPQLNPAAEETAAAAIEAPKPAQDKRIFGVLPNYRTVSGTTDIEPLTSRQKMTIAAKDSFDWPSYITAAGFAGLSQLSNTNPSFGQGIRGYSKRYAAGVGDQITGNMLTEGVFPVWFREDPRYFRLGTGSGWSRFRYAATRTLITRTDSGGRRFNFSEIGGNTTAVAISNAYSPDTRNVSDNLTKLGIQVATDTFSNILKEFWPDFKRKFLKK